MRCAVQFVAVRRFDFNGYIPAGIQLRNRYKTIASCGILTDQFPVHFGQAEHGTGQRGSFHVHFFKDDGAGGRVFKTQCFFFARIQQDLLLLQVDDVPVRGCDLRDDNQAGVDLRQMYETVFVGSKTADCFSVFISDFKCCIGKRLFGDAVCFQDGQRGLFLVGQCDCCDLAFDDFHRMLFVRQDISVGGRNFRDNIVIRLHAGQAGNAIGTGGDILIIFAAALCNPKCGALKLDRGVIGIHLCNLKAGLGIVFEGDFTGFVGFDFYCVRCTVQDIVRRA